MFQPLHVHECEQLSFDIFGLPLAIFTKVCDVMRSDYHEGDEGGFRNFFQCELAVSFLVNRDFHIT